MPTQVCDRSPCDLLEATLEVLATVKDEEHLDLVIVAKNQKLAKVTITYCPFCGTRIGIDITERFLPPRRRK